MSYAGVILDIPTRALSDAFDYSVPASLAGECVVGATVLVTFARRPCVGYVVSMSEQPPSGLDPKRILPVESVLAPSAFDEVQADLASWMSSEYVAPVSACLRLMLAPGQTVKVKREDNEAPWQLVVNRAQAVDDRWVELTEEGRSFEPIKTAVRQRQVIEALRLGPMRAAELSATVPGSLNVIRNLEPRGIVAVTHRRLLRGSGDTTLSSALAPRPAQLTDGQLAALDAIDQARDAACGDVVLVDGVTGSGKTEVYLSAIERALASGRGAIVLVPEISLTAQTVGRFRSRFGDEVAVLHSRLSTGERFDQWDLIRTGVARVVVGARSALFAPVSNLGLIIIDEEHDGAYKQDKAPRYHAREVAAKLAELRGCAVVLGSATPSMESLERCRVGDFGGKRWTRVEMPERPGLATLPTVTIVDMLAQTKMANTSIFSYELQSALLEVAERGEKAVLLHNRRGFANFLMCRDCGTVPECPHCSTALTYHEHTHQLVCHTCGSSWPARAYPDPSTKCPNCGSRYLAQLGVGIQRVEAELRALLPPDVAIVRMDTDTTKNKGGHQRVLEEFDKAPCAVLVGTQMVAKGLDFPQVTLVGVVNADTTLKLPDFRASENTYDLLAQVAGRAGRGEVPGRVIVQTRWATHPAIVAVASQDRASFVEFELNDRQQTYYPPFSRLVNIVLSGPDARRVDDMAMRLAEALRAQLPDDGAWRVLGPAECVHAKVKDRFRRHVLLKVPPNEHPGPQVCAIVASLKCPDGVTISIDIDACDFV